MEQQTLADIRAVVRELTELRYIRRRHAADPRKWSQRGLANRLGWPQSQLSDYETGQVAPGLANLARWADALGATLTSTFVLTFDRSQS